LHQQLNEHVLAWEADEAWCEDLSPGDAKSDCRVLSQEDLLSRALDISIFWFFEKRDLVRQKLDDLDYHADENKLAAIAEYPPEWRRWQKDSFELRDAVQAGRRRSGDGSPMVPPRLAR